MQQVAVGALPAKNVVESNVSLFYLQPVIRQGPTPPNDDLITVGTADTTQTPPVTPVTVQLDPALESTQQVQLLLNELAPPAGAVPLSFTFDADASQISANSVTFSTFGTRPGAYLVRVRVDGAESVLRTDPVTRCLSRSGGDAVSAPLAPRGAGRGQAWLAANQRALMAEVEAVRSDAARPKRP